MKRQKRSKDRKIYGKCTNGTNRRSPVWPVCFIYIIATTQQCLVTSPRDPGVVNLHVNVDQFSTTARRVTSPTWGPLPPCKQILIYIIATTQQCLVTSPRDPGVVSLHVNAGQFSTTARRVTSPTWSPPPPCKQALTQRAEILSRRSDLTPQRAKNTVGMICLWFCGTEVAFDIKQTKAGWLHSFLSFLPETNKLQSAVYSEWK